jgi:predicted NACHT family NTPase
LGKRIDFPKRIEENYIGKVQDVLLKKWDARSVILRVIRSTGSYPFKRKEDLLSQLAFQTFDRGDYFFKQAVVEQHIINYIRNLPGANEDEEALQLDSESQC